MLRVSVQIKQTLCQCSNLSEPSIIGQGHYYEHVFRVLFHRCKVDGFFLGCYYRVMSSTCWGLPIKRGFGECITTGWGGPCLSLGNQRFHLHSQRFPSYSWERGFLPQASYFKTIKPDITKLILNRPLKFDIWGSEELWNISWWPLSVSSSVLNLI